MARVSLNDNSLYAIADAIRGKLDVETTYLPSQMAAAIESIPTGGGGDLTSADEGKVVVESGGSYVLAAQTSRTVVANGTYDTTTNNEVIVDVSDDSYITYWTLAYMLETSGQIGVGGRSGGFKFVSSELAFISKIRVLSTASTVNVYVTRGDGRVVSSRVGVQVEPNQWSEIEYSNPITIYKGAPYTVWYTQGDGEPLVYFAVATSSRISYITKYENLYSESADTTPTTNAGDSVTYGIDVYVEYYTKDSRQMIDKTITQNGIYSASGDHVDGYSCVTVNVAGGGGSDLTSADEGKVVVESSGDYVLQAQTSRSVSQNGTYDTTTNNEVVVNVPSSGGSSGGEYIFTPSVTSGYSSATRTVGYKFRPSRELTLTKIRVYGDSSTVSIYMSDDNDETILSIVNEQITEGIDNHVELDEPITLDPNTEYFIWKSLTTNPKYNANVHISSLITITGAYTGNTQNVAPTSSAAANRYCGLDMLLS